MNSDHQQIKREGERRDEELHHGRITKEIIGAFFEVYNELGSGFPEVVYREALAIVLRERGLLVECEVPIAVRFRGRIIGRFRADVLVERLVIVELKAVKSVDHAFVEQLMHYLRATTIEVGLLLNFGPKPTFKRVSFENSRKPYPP